MLKFMYKVEAHNFSDMGAFENFLNEKGKDGYELIQWQIIDTSFMMFYSQVQPVHGAFSVLITWKIEIPNGSTIR